MRSLRRKRKARRPRTRRQRGGNQEKCIFVQLRNGLGNQLFLYAAALSVKNKTKLPICLPPLQNLHSSKDYRSTIFKQGIPINPDELKPRMNASVKLLEHFDHDKNTFNITSVSETSNTNLTLSTKYYHKYKPIESVIPIIREDCKKAFEELYPDLKAKIPVTSAFMHVRRGDYAEAGTSLGRDYYDRALKELDPVVGITDIYILSDDIPWCKEQNWQSLKSLHWFESPDELEALYLMSLCLAGAIVSLSTFSTWGVILGADQNQSSTIIYPVDLKMDFPSRYKAI